ncbi:MAG: VanZ family protein, partial [Nitrospinae bacterium]|nr:VanZ family protein [Nitrospinota bacterium]
MPDSLNLKRTYVILSLCYLAFVIYGSFIPFQFRPLPIAEAIDRFYRIPYLHLGIQSRADFIANILLYIPLSFFLIGALCKKTHSLAIKCAATLFVFILCILIAGLIEFIQVFFPPRTVSLNDVIAEILGTIIGIVFWYTIGGRLTRLWSAISAGGREGLQAALVIYALFYLALCLFPFDFILSRSELSWKLATNSYHAFVAEETCQ